MMKRVTLLPLCFLIIFSVISFAQNNSDDKITDSNNRANSYTINQISKVFDHYKELNLTSSSSNKFQHSNSQQGQWNYVGPDSATQVTNLHIDSSTNSLFIGTTFGFWYCSLDDFVWTRREIPGAFGIETLSIATHPNISGRIVLGRVNPFFTGYIAVTSDWGLSSQSAYFSQSGMFKDVKNVPSQPDVFYACNWSSINPGVIVKSTDGGLTFSLLSNTIHFQKTELAVDYADPNIVYCSGSSRITKTTDGGSNWFPCSNGIPSDRGVYSVAINPLNSNILVCSSDSGIHRTTDAGQNWTYSSTSYVVRHFAFNPVNPQFVAGVTLSSAKIIISTDGGINWQLFPDTLGGSQEMDLIFSPDGTKLFTVLLDDGPYWIDVSGYVPVELISFNATVSLNNVKLSWQTATELNNRGFEVERASSSTTPICEWTGIGFVNGNGTTSEKKYYHFIDDLNLNQNLSLPLKYRLKQIDFDGSFEYSKEIEIEVTQPTEFALFQNYPNPFNPTTKISWQLPADRWLTLKIYDMLGNEVVTLVNKELPAGKYEFDFNASSLSSGVYFYKLTTDSYSDTRKMILMK